jgi:hypothetical protein
MTTDEKVKKLTMAMLSIVRMLDEGGNEPSLIDDPAKRQELTNIRLELTNLLQDGESQA